MYMILDTLRARSLLADQESPGVVEPLLRLVSYRPTPHGVGPKTLDGCL
jgi:hypothetical protein